jgi:hypothetical protein
MTSRPFSRRYFSNFTSGREAAEPWAVISRIPANTRNIIELNFIHVSPDGGLSFNNS